MRKKWIWAALMVCAFMLTGCQGKEKEEAAAPQPTEEAAAALNEREDGGPVQRLANAVMDPYGQELSLVSQHSLYNLTFTIPGDMIQQLARDAEEISAQPVNGRYQFLRRQEGNYAYQSTVEEAMGTEPPLTVTPDPENEAPMDSQLMGDYTASGGGLFNRVRAYDVSEDLSSGKVEISDTLNGNRTGHEAFSYAVRGQELYFVDAVLDMTADMDGVAIGGGYLAAAGVLRPDGLDIIEYRLADLSQLPDPGQMNWSSLAASVEIISRLTAEGENVTVTP